MNLIDSRIDRHYTPANLGDSILEGLSRAGKDPQRFAYDDLSPVDHFHARGSEATAELARLADLQPSTSVLDVGGGLGGPARTLAAAFGCRVTVLDTTNEFCRVGEMLTERAGLSHRVKFFHGSALDMPFEDATYDLVWTEHCTMNIADKETLYREIRRVLRPRGRLAMHEIMAGPKQPIHFPVPWASEPGLSFLRPMAEVRSLLAAGGFEEVVFLDQSQTTLDWLREHYASAPEALPPLGLHLLLGENFRPAFENVIRNFAECRTTICQAVYRRD